uniref:SPRY-associated domain-containing protein n=1 Tax=Pelodiscus sinensis TaxID=13735 RepID=K7GAQ8_PELSI
MFLRLQEKLQAQLKTLRAEREKLLGLKVSREETSQEHLKWTQAEWQKIVTQFQQLRQFLQEQERLLLAQLEQLDEMIVKTWTDTVTKLSEQISHLSERIGELEEKCQKPVSEFLQEIRSTLSSCEEGQAQQPEEMAPELGERVRGFSQKVTALSETLREFKANVTLDPDMAHPRLVPSEDGKRERWADTWQPVADTPARTLGPVCWAERASPWGDITGRWRWGMANGLWGCPESLRAGRDGSA